MPVTTEVVKAYYSPTRNRRYFSKEAAIKAEAKARIFKKYPSEPYESETGYAGYNIWDDRPEFYQRALRFLSYLIKKNIN